MDALGNLLKFIVTPGQRHEITQADSLVQDLKNTMLLADKGYDANGLVEQLAKQKSIAIVPPKKNTRHKRDYDCHVYKERHLIECFFGKIKHFRRVFSRFDKTATVFMSFLQCSGKQSNRAGKLSLSEAISVMIFYHFSQFKHFKIFYQHLVIKGNLFNNPPCYERFIALIPSLFLPLVIMMHYLSGKKTGIYCLKFGGRTPHLQCVVSTYFFNQPIRI